MYNENRAFWMTLLIYGVTGPLVGLVCVLIYLSGGHFRWFSGLYDVSKLSTVVMFAYFFGLLPAVVAGYFIGAIGMHYGSVRFSHAIVAGTAVGLMTAVTIFLLSGPLFFDLETAIVFFSVCLVATLADWLVVRRWWCRDQIGTR